MPKATAPPRASDLARFPFRSRVTAPTAARPGAAVCPAGPLTVL